MAISWVTALKMVPWGDVIQAAPSVLKAAKGLMKKNPPAAEDESTPSVETSSTPTSSASNAGELALQQVQHLEARLAHMEATQQATALVLEKMAEQQSQIVKTVGILRTGITRLVWACSVLCLTVVGMLIYILSR